MTELQQNLPVPSLDEEDTPVAVAPAPRPAAAPPPGDVTPMHGVAIPPYAPVMIGGGGGGSGGGGPRPTLDGLHMRVSAVEGTLIEIRTIRKMFNWLVGVGACALVAFVVDIVVDQVDQGHLENDFTAHASDDSAHGITTELQKIRGDIGIINVKLDQAARPAASQIDPAQNSRLQNLEEQAHEHRRR